MARAAEEVVAAALQCAFRRSSARARYGAARVARAAATLQRAARCRAGRAAAAARAERRRFAAAAAALQARCRWRLRWSWQAIAGAAAAALQRMQRAHAARGRLAGRRAEAVRRENAELVGGGGVAGRFPAGAALHPAAGQPRPATPPPLWAWGRRGSSRRPSQRPFPLNY